MSDWSIGSVLLALLAAIFVPALLVHFTLGRNGGHKLFKGKTREEIRDMPYEMMRTRVGNRLRSSAATLIGLFVVVVVFPLSCRIGMPINFLGLSDRQLTGMIIMGVVVVALVGLVVLGRRRT